MNIIDLREDKSLKGRTHYALTLGGRSIVYCYIRKNACTAFKGLFQSESPFRNQKKGNALCFMNSYHKASMTEVQNSDFRICVIRKPEDRVLSTFKNKFIQQIGNKDIFQSYNKLVGSPEKATFRDFVLKYLAHPSQKLDPHLHSQKSHMMPIVYNAVFYINDLFEGMVSIVGKDLAEKYFLVKQNSTSASLKHDTTDPNSEPILDASDVPAYELYDNYNRMVRNT